MKRTVQFLIIMVLLSFNGLVAGAQMIVFKDVPLNFWAQEEIGWAQERNLVKGYSDGTFKPGHSITEAELLAITLRYFKLEEGNADRVTHWAEGLYQTAKMHNLPLHGYESIELRNQPAIRGLFAQLLAKSQGENPELSNAVDWMFENEITIGRYENGASNIERYDPAGNMTRAQVAVFFKRLADLEITQFIESEEEHASELRLSLSTVADSQYIYTINDNDCIERLNKDGSNQTVLSCGNFMELAVDEHYIYAVAYVPSYALFRLNKDGSLDKSLNVKVERKGNTTRIYTEETFSNLVVDNGWIYYLEEDNSLWRFTTDYKNKTKLKNYVSGFIIDKETIYYRDSGSKLHKMKPDGTEDQLINNEKVRSFQIEGNWIYYIPNVSGNPGIKKMDFEGRNITSIITYENAWAESFIVHDNWIYFTMTTMEEEAALYKISKDTVHITDLQEAEKLDNGYCSNLHAFWGKLWYTKNSASFYRLDLEEEQTSFIGSGYKYLIGQDQSSIYYIDTKNQMYGAGELYKASFDGRNPVLLASNVSQAVLSDEYIYYHEEFGSLFRMSKVGERKESILSNGTDNFFVSNGSLILRDSYHVNGKYNLSIINYDRQEKKILAEDCSEILTVSDDWIYYLSDNTLIRIKTDGTAKEILADHVRKSIVITGNEIYYLSSENGHSIFKKQLNTNSAPEKMIRFDPQDPKQPITIIKVDADSIYYTSYNSIYKISIKGGEPQEIVSNVFTSFPTSDHWFYYIGEKDEQMSYQVSE